MYSSYNQEYLIPNISSDHHRKITMQILLAALTCLLLHSTFSSSIIIPQVPLCYAPTTEASYGYAGPGVYRILSYVNSYAVSLNTSDSTTGLVSR